MCVSLTRLGTIKAPDNRDSVVSSMNDHVITASATIDAPASKLYEILANYREGHPAILPRPPFVGLEVEQGGVGAGTIIRVTMRALGRDQFFRAVVSEPEPGRTLVETNDTGYVTTFIVDPDTSGERSKVTISTEPPARPGVGGALERLFVGRFLRTAYERELENLAAVAGAPAPRKAA